MVEVLVDHHFESIEWEVARKNNLHLTFARVSLLIAIQKIIAEGLDIFNITPLTEMH